MMNKILRVLCKSGSGMLKTVYQWRKQKLLNTLGAHKSTVLNSTSLRNESTRSMDSQSYLL